MDLKIKTKYNFNDTVFFLKNNEIRQGIILGIHYYKSSRDEETIRYAVGFGGSLLEDQVFRTKEELAENLIKTNG